MALRKLLPYALISKLFFPIFSTLLLHFLKPLLHVLHSQTTDSFNFASFTTYLTLSCSNKSNPNGETEPGNFHYKDVLGEQILCVFCMSDVGEGERVRKLSCSHLFHSSCLDSWLEHRRTNCPLCRCSLALLGAKAKPADEMDEEVEDYAPLLLAFLQREWWGVVHPLT